MYSSLMSFQAGTDSLHHHSSLINTLTQRRGKKIKKQKANEEPRSCRSQTGELILCVYNAEYR